MSQQPSNQNRPLSPHLQVYKLPLTAKLSILHRLTGLTLSFATLILVYWLFCLAFLPENAIAFYNVFSSNAGKGILIFFSFAYFYHFCNGIRHLIWDTGSGLNKKSLNLSNWLVIAAAAILTLILWFIGV